MTSNDVINAVASKSIVNLPKQAAYPIDNENEITNIPPEFLSSEFSIIKYGSGYVSNQVKSI